MEAGRHIARVARALGQLLVLVWSAALLLVATVLGLCAIFGLLLGGLGLGIGFWGPLRYRELHQIEAKLEELPGVKVVDSWGNEDITFEDIGVTVELAGKGRISFDGVTLDSFEQDGDPYIYVRQVGPYFFASCDASVLADGKTLEGHGHGSGLNLGPKGGFGAHLPFVAHRVQDVIANYDALVARLEKWPRYPSFLEVACIATHADGTTGACTTLFWPDGGVRSDQAVTRLAVWDEPVVLHACDDAPLSAEEQRATDRALQSMQRAFEDRPSGKRAPPDKR